MAGLDALNSVALHLIHAMARSWLKCPTPVEKGARSEDMRVGLLIEIEPAKEDGGGWGNGVTCAVDVSVY